MSCSAPELLPQPAGAIGQLLPPGAGGSLLRSTAFFDGAGAAAPLTVLTAWVGLGLLAAAVAAWAGAAPPRPPRPRLDRPSSTPAAGAADPAASDPPPGVWTTSSTSPRPRLPSR